VISVWYYLQLTGSVAPATWRSSILVFILNCNLLLLNSCSTAGYFRLALWYTCILALWLQYCATCFDPHLYSWRRLFITDNSSCNSLIVIHSIQIRTKVIMFLNKIPKCLATKANSVPCLFYHKNVSVKIDYIILQYYVYLSRI